MREKNIVFNIAQSSQEFTPLPRLFDAAAQCAANATATRFAATSVDVPLVDGCANSILASDKSREKGKDSRRGT